MSVRRILPLVLALTVAVALAASTGGTGTATVERSAHVTVASDDAAYLGFQQTATPTGDGNATLNVTVTNRFPAGTAFTTVDVTADDETVHLAADHQLGPGASATARFDVVPCGASVTAVASGDGVSVHLNRTVVCS